MKHTLYLTAFLLALAPMMAFGNDSPYSINLNAGTQGAGISIGYELTPSVRFRLRGAAISYKHDTNWSGSEAQLKLYGDNIGLLVDIFPGDGNFYISAGLNFSESKMRCKSRFYRAPGLPAKGVIGGTEYKITSGNMAEIRGKYSWNHVQPYIGIGYQNTLFGSNTFYYNVDLGINFMGSGDFNAGHSGNMQYHDPVTNLYKPVTDEVIEKSIRKEGRDFFKIADDLCVYPVLQLGIGARF